ncbi:hypothetical protein HaLaN_07987 [Haematococcus lacustris]|uniref:Uncharacterized protein n=1 Tax=Haematococcus lacustris TaxID=44745 RepID=A0A699YPV0_HAELA|nr:hypothetical protein HaLaN_07987 [Haematococcus lacustris]
MPYSRSILVSTCTSRLLNGSAASNTSAYLEVFNTDDICDEDEGEESDDDIAEQVNSDTRP